MTCDGCTELAVVFVPGTEETRQMFLLVRGVPERRFCLNCARQAGWPWVISEKTSYHRYTKSAEAS